MPGPRAPEQERKQQILAAAERVAARETLAGLTIRSVGEEAGLSSGLVLFHFESKELLLMSLLERLLQQTLEGSVAAAEASEDPVPREAFRSLLTREVQRVSADRERTELFFDYWVMGTCQPEIRQRLRASLERYRELIATFTAPLLERAPKELTRMTPHGFAAMAVSFIEGCALQAVIDPTAFDIEAYLANLEAWVDLTFPD